MTDNMDNIVLEQLKAIRSELKDMHSKIDDLQVGQQGLQGIVVGLGYYVQSIDTRVEHLEDKLGA